jgi:hypothetical protein
MDYKASSSIAGNNALSCPIEAISGDRRFLTYPICSMYCLIFFELQDEHLDFDMYHIWLNSLGSTEGTLLASSKMD